MANKPRDADRASYKRSRLPLYFFVNDELHKRLHIIRGRDTVKCWNYKDAKTVTLTYTDVLRRFQRTFKTTEVALMVHRSRIVIDRALSGGMIERPQMNYSLDENRVPLSYHWSEKDIMGLLDYLSTVHRGRPRKDGEVVPGYLPTPRELRAIIHGEGQTLYTKDDNNNFVPTWRAKEW